MCGWIFPIQSLIDEEQSQAWVLNHFHPEGLGCPKCQASVARETRSFRKTETSGLQVYRYFLRPFRGVHKKFLSGYITICEFIMNMKSVSVDFISRLVKSTYS